MKDIENVEQARKSFNHILDNKKYAGIIKDDRHLSVLLGLVETAGIIEFWISEREQVTWRFRWLKDLRMQVFAA